VGGGKKNLKSSVKTSLPKLSCKRIFVSLVSLVFVLVLFSSFFVSTSNEVSLFASGAPDSVVDENWYYGSWSIVNLLLGVFGLMLAILVACVLKLQKQYRTSWFSLVPVLAMGFVGIFIFLLTESMNGQMVLIDRWSMLFYLIFIVEIIVIVITVFAIFVSKHKNNQQHLQPMTLRAQQTPENLNLEIEKSKQRLANLSIAYANGKISEEVFVTTSKKLEAKIASLEAMKTKGAFSNS